MKHWISLLVVGICFHQAFGQAAQVALENKSATLSERYQLMKSNSQTFQDYKVIKEYILDGVWKISQDTLTAISSRLENAHQQIAALKQEVQQIKSTLDTHKQSVAQIEYDSDHISLAGISFTKNVFRLLAFTIMAVLVGIIVFLMGHWKLSVAKMKEHMLIADMISREFDDFKKKALEKQVKLSRELQNERNKLATLRQSNH